MNSYPTVLLLLQGMKRWHFNCDTFLVMMVLVQTSLMIPHGVSASTTSTDAIVAIPTKDLATRVDALSDHQFQPKMNLQGNNGSMIKEQRGNKSKSRLPAAAQLLSGLLQLTTGGNNRALKEIDGSIISRSLGDFDELNEILAEAEISLPELSFEAGTFFRNELILTVSQTVCSGLSVGDIIIRHANVGTNNTDILFTLELQDFAFNCDIDYSYDWLFDGSGDGQIYSSGNDASIGVTFTSADFSSKPPTGAQLSSCGANMQIDSIDLQGGLDTQIINAIEEPLRSPIENALEELICEEADAISNALINLITTLDEFIEPHQVGIPHELIDPLYPEQNSLDMDLVLESGVELLAYNDSRLYQVILPFIDNMLGGPVDDPNSPTGTGMDLGVNKIARAAILNDDRALVIRSDSLPNNGILVDTENVLSRFTITIEKIALKGLDTMTKFNPLNVYPNGEYTLTNSFGFNSVDVEVDLAIEMRSATSDRSNVGNNESVVENISMDFSLDDLNVNFAFLLAIDKNKIANTPLGAIMTDFDSIISCALGMGVHSAEVSFLSVTVGNLKTPKFDGFVSSGIDRVVTSGVGAMFAMYEGALLDLMPNIFQVSFRNTINEMLMKALQDSQDCTFGAKEEGVASKYVNFADLFLNVEKAVSIGGLGKEQYGILIESLRSIFESDAIELAGTSFLNDFIVRPLTSSQSGSDGSIIFNDSFLDMGGNVEIGELNASYRIKIPNLSIENLDTISSPLSLLIPSSPQALDNYFTLGAGAKPIIVNTGFLFAFDNGVDKIENELDIELEMFSTRVEINAVIEIFEELFLGFPIKDVGIIDCWLSKIPTPLLDEFGLSLSDSSRSMFFDNLSLSASKVQLNVRCIKCTSPEFEDLVKGLSSVEGISDLTKAMNDTFDWIANILAENIAQIKIERLLVNSHMNCPHSSSYTPAYQAPDYNAIQYSTLPETQDNFLIQFVATIAGLTVVIIVITTVIRWIAKIKYGSWARSLSPENRFAISEKARREKSWQMKMDRKTRSIFRSSLVPVTVRLLIPLVIIGNILLFLSGHLSLGAEVTANLNLAGQNVPLGRVFEFSLGSSIIDMWESGAKELAAIVAIFSGVWPYTKQLITFCLWFCPTKLISVSKRGSILQWLDTLGKWSFVDIFVLVITLAAFRIKVKSPDDFAFLPLNFYSLDLLVIPSWGLYANMIAQVLSQVSSHVVIHYHRKIVNDELNEENTYLEELPSGKRLALCENIFELDGAKEGNGLVVKHGVTIYILILSLAVCTLLCCGCAFDTIQFETFGLLGIFIEAGQDFEDASTSYGVFTMLKVMVEQAGYTGVTSDYIGLGFLAFLFVSTVLLVPLAQIVLLLLRWFRPLNRKERSKYYVTIETLLAWQYSEVFILSVIITSWQLAPVSEFFINDKCEGLKNTFDTLVLYGVIENTDAQCFRVEPSIKFATWLLMAGAVGLAFLNHFISTAAMHQNGDEVSIYRDNFIITTPNDATTTELHDQNNKSHNAFEDDIKIPSLRFTDYYRWLLQPQEISAMSVANEAKLQIQPDTNNSSDIEVLDLAIPVPSPQRRKESKQAEKLPKSDQWEIFYEA